MHLNGSTSPDKQRDPGLAEIDQSNPMFKNLRKDAGYTELLRELLYRR